MWACGPQNYNPLQISITAPKKCQVRQPFGAVIHKGEKGKRGGREEREKVAKGRKSVPKGTLIRDFSSKGRPKES